MNKYNVFGLVFHSPDIALPNLKQDFSNKNVDVLIKESKEINNLKMENKYNTNFLYMSDDSLFLDIENIGKFKVNNGKEILINLLVSLKRSGKTIISLTEDKLLDKILDNEIILGN